MGKNRIIKHQNKVEAENRTKVTLERKRFSVDHFQIVLLSFVFHTMARMLRKFCDKKKTCDNMQASCCFSL